MVLMRRPDKRRGNESDALSVASDKSIGANKGVRSLSGARSGRFAADMRAHVGGYGRADQTWGVDHPWHSSGGGALFAQLCAKDHMEEGVQEGEDEEDGTAEPPVRGLSRAQLKKRKAKLKKTGLPAHEAAAKALEEAKEAAQRRIDEEQRRLAELVKARQDAAIRKKQKRQQQQEKLGLESAQVDTTDVETKRAEKRKAEKQKKKDERQKVVEQTEQQKIEEHEEMKTREF